MITVSHTNNTQLRLSRMSQAGVTLVPSLGYLSFKAAPPGANPDILVEFSTSFASCSLEEMAEITEIIKRHVKYLQTMKYTWETTDITPGAIVRIDGIQHTILVQACTNAESRDNLHYALGSRSSSTIHSASRRLNEMVTLLNESGATPT